MKYFVLMIWALLIGGVTGWFVTYQVYQYIRTESTDPIQGTNEQKVAERKPINMQKTQTRRVLVDSRSVAPTMELLRSLGYVEGTVDPDHQASDVLIHDRKGAFAGYNLYSSRKQSGATLMDMEGKVVHTWALPQKEAWQYTHLLPNGDVLVIIKEKRLLKVDKDSNIIWSISGRFHHDLWVAGEEIYTLIRRAEHIPYIHPKYPVLVDYIAVISMQGEKSREHSLLDIIQRSPYAFLLPSISHVSLQQSEKLSNELDILHTNHIEVFDGSLAHKGALYGAGNLLVSVRNINVIAILQAETHRILFIWGPSNLTLQHHPTLLQNGHLLVFDNGTTHSRVLELDPITRSIVWRYGPREDFFSKTRGSNQRLPNGNTLITESDRGYVMEVDRKGNIVWQFANPNIDAKHMREAIWRMTRIDPKKYPFLP